MIHINAYFVFSVSSAVQALPVQSPDIPVKAIRVYKDTG